MKVSIEVELSEREVEIIKWFHYGTVYGDQIHNTGSHTLLLHKGILRLSKKIRGWNCPRWEWQLTDVGKQLKRQIEAQQQPR